MLLKNFSHQNARRVVTPGMSRSTVVKTALFAVVLAVPLTIYFAPETAAFIYNVVAALAPLWLPALLAYLAWPLWLNFIRSQFISNIQYATIELKPGVETPPTARTMELVFYSLYYRTDISRMQAFVFGSVRVPWSLEIYAHKGAVRFFIHVPSAHLPAIEARIRGEYHDIDIAFVRDYSREINFSPFSMRLAMREYTLAKPDPYPLKTYAEYEAEQPRRDVFNETVEELASVGEKEHLFVSFIIRPHQRERFNPFHEPEDTLHSAANEEIKKLVGLQGEMHTLPVSTKKIVHAIESALQKPSFDCGVRALYMAEKDTFDESRNQKLSNLLDRFNDEDLNSFTAYDPYEKMSWFQTFLFETIPVFGEEYLLQLYRRRAFFAPPYYGRAFVLNTEELATVFHIPHVGRGSALAHLRGAKLNPPDNLPV